MIWTRGWASSNVFYMVCRPLINNVRRVWRPLVSGLRFSLLYLQQIKNNTLYLIIDNAKAIGLQIKSTIRFADTLAKDAITMANSYVQFVHPKRQ